MIASLKDQSMIELPLREKSSINGIIKTFSSQEKSAFEIASKSNISG